MSHAYSEVYLNDMKALLGGAFDYAANQCGIAPDEFAKMLEATGYADMIERCNPGIVGGMSGVELVWDVVGIADPEIELPDYEVPAGVSAERWAGEALAAYQWDRGRRIVDILEAFPMSEIVACYEACKDAETAAVNEMFEQKASQKPATTKLAQVIEINGSPTFLLERLSGVEQNIIEGMASGEIDSNTVEAGKLYSLANLLAMDIYDVLEAPSA